MTLKTRLHEHLMQALAARKMALQQQRTQISVESSESGKGSAGDKHEVGIAMAQIEIEKLDQQTALLQQQISTLKKLDPVYKNEQILHGALFEIDQNWYYCSIPFGQFNFEDGSYFCLSPEAPLFLALKGKKEQECALFNGKNWKINKIY
jgi:hypothetical protein